MNAYGAFQDYYTTAFLNQFSTSSISWVGTIQGFLLLLIGVMVGPLFDRGPCGLIFAFDIAYTSRPCAYTGDNWQLLSRSWYDDDESVEQILSDLPSTRRQSRSRSWLPVCV